MKPHEPLPPLPAPESGHPDRGRKNDLPLVLKPESPWATRIREMLKMKQDGAHYVPYMPVPRNRRLFKKVRALAQRDASSRKRS